MRRFMTETAAKEGWGGGFGEIDGGRIHFWFGAWYNVSNSSSFNATRCHMRNHSIVPEEGLAMKGRPSGGSGGRRVGMEAAAAGGCVGEDGGGSTFCVGPAGVPLPDVRSTSLIFSTFDTSGERPD